MKPIVKLLRSLILPLSIVIAGVLLFKKLNDLPSAVGSVLNYIPHVIFIISLFLSLRFNRSRIFFMSLLLMISLLMVLYAPKLFMRYDNTILYLVLGILLPINIAIFSILKERGFFTFWGISKFIFIGLQLFFIISILSASNGSALDILYKDYIDFPLSTSFPQLVIFSIFISFVVVISKAYFSSSFSDGPFLASLLAMVMALKIEETVGFLILFSAVGMILIISIIQDSYRMSYLDELTGLPGRRALKEDMLKLSGMYSVAMVDIDFFKKFNDKHGHDIGDEVLKMVANCLTKVTGGGKAFRYGGEEFTILFPGKSDQEALPHLETLREMVEKRPFILRSSDRPKKKPTTKTTSTRKNTSASAGRKLFVTISIGVANRSKEIKAPNEVMKNADKALYRAKKKGRNCVCK